MAAPALRLPMPGPRQSGALLAAAALALLAAPALWHAALALEALALAFWIWARADTAAAEQIPRWSWLRRPAQALWLAAAVHAVAPALAHDAIEPTGTMRMLAGLEAAAIVWAGLELLAALPLARPYSDHPGPLVTVRPWIPVILPSAGFLVLWRHAPHWLAVPEARALAIVLLLLTTSLGTLRAFGRRQWTSGLRWLAVTDSALAGMLLALRAVPVDFVLPLWLAACGGRAIVLAGELRGAAARRRASLARLWRVSMWVSSAALAWPVLLELGFGGGGGPRALAFTALALPVALSSWITVRRMVRAPERRLVPRPGGSVTVSHVGAVLTLGLGPLALAGAWWGGLEASWPGFALALAPPVAGGWLALLAERRAGALVPPRAAETTPDPDTIAARAAREARLTRLVERGGRAARALARTAFRVFVELERRLVALLVGFVRAVSSPLRDLHTGDAQEYLLFLVGLTVLALVLPLLA